MELKKNINNLRIKNDVKVDFDKVCDSIKFKSKDLDEIHIIKALEMAEKSLEETNRSFDSNTNKSSIIIGFLLTMSIGLMSYFFSQNSFSNSSFFSPFLFTVLITSILLSFLAIFLSNNFKAVEWYKSGMTPSSFLHEEFLKRKNKNSKYDFYKGILYNSIGNYERNILSNEGNNTIASIRVNTALYFLVRIPIISLLVYLSSWSINYLL